MIKPSRHANVAIFVPHAGCPHQCVFCNQRHIAGQRGLPSAEDIRSACETARKTLGADTRAQIAFFGGSFTAIQRADMEALLKAAAPYVQQGWFDGIRISTRPDAIDEERLSLLKKYGVTTVELGAQSMDDAVLRRCGRGHTAQQVRTAARLIREVGLSLGLQMMTGLPGDTDNGAMATAVALADLQPDEVRIYPTLVIDGTPLAEAYRRGDYQPQSLEEAIALCSSLLRFFEDERHIPVIRLGLHAEESMTQHCLAGPMHPAFREVCEGRICRDKAEQLMRDGTAADVVLCVHPSCVSRMVGHGRENVKYFAEKGFAIHVVADEQVAYGDIKRRDVIT